MHQTCPAKYDLRMNNGWTLRRRSGALGFGSAIHAGLAEWYRHMHNKTTEERFAIACKAITDGWDLNVPVDDWRTLAKCLSVFREYTIEYPTESWEMIGAAADRPVVEQTFTLATGMYLPCGLSYLDTTLREHCDAIGHKSDAVCTVCNAPREPIEYGGIFDGMVRFGGNVYALEHKSTSVMGDYYFNQFKPNNQVAGYIWASGQMSGLEVGGAIVNAIGVYKTGKTKFKRQVSTRDKLDIEMFLKNVYATCCEIKQHQLTGFYPQRTGSCTQYGLCEFHQVHTLSDPAWQQKRLEQDYEQSKWDYTRRDDNAPVEGAA